MDKKMAQTLKSLASDSRFANLAKRAALYMALRANGYNGHHLVPHQSI